MHLLTPSRKREKRASYIYRRLPLGDFSKSGARASLVIVTMRALKSAARYFHMANNQGENGERAVPRERGERGGHHNATHPFSRRFIRRLLVLKNNSGRVRFASTSFRIIAARARSRWLHVTLGRSV